jgi:hypothetical protein
MVGDRRRLGLPSLLAVAALAACAGGNQTKPELVDPIIIPETAVEIDHIALFNGEDWTSLNRRMIVVWSARKPYLLVFEHACTGLMTAHPLVVRQTTGSALYARFDFIVTEHNARCHIDRMYAIQREDVTALKEELKN